MRSRATTAGVIGLGLVLASPDAAEAHGIASRSDLPIPIWLMVYGATIVLLISLAALIGLWPQPRLRKATDHVLVVVPTGVARWAERILAWTGLFLLVLVVATGLLGSDKPDANLAPVFVYILFWVGLVLLSMLLGDVFRLVNPWRTVGQALFGQDHRDVRPYPVALGYLPAIAGLVAFGALELAYDGGSAPRNVAIATIVYTIATLAGMGRFGVDAWLDGGEAFSVYFGLIARVGPTAFTRAGFVRRNPVARLVRVTERRGIALLTCSMIGLTTFDGFSQTQAWSNLTDRLDEAGLDGRMAATLVSAAGLAVAIAAISLLYHAATGLTGLVLGRRHLAPLLAPSLVPIAIAYLVAHYTTFLLYGVQLAIKVASDPFGSGLDLFGTARMQISLSPIPADVLRYIQVGAVFLGHIAALVVAHDLVLELEPPRSKLTRAQIPMLVAMIALTTLALWLLANANA